MLDIVLQLAQFLFEGTELGAREGTGVFGLLVVVDGALAVVAVPAVVGERLEEQRCGDEGNQHSGDEARHCGQRAQHRRRERERCAWKCVGTSLVAPRGLWLLGHSNLAGLVMVAGDDDVRAGKDYFLPGRRTVARSISAPPDWLRMRREIGVLTFVHGT
jgi:hypothetical protein